MNNNEQQRTKGSERMTEQIDKPDPLDLATDLLFGVIGDMQTSAIDPEKRAATECILHICDTIAAIDQARSYRVIGEHLNDMSVWLERIENRC